VSVLSEILPVLFLIIKVVIVAHIPVVIAETETRILHYSRKIVGLSVNRYFGRLEHISELKAFNRYVRPFTQPADKTDKTIQHGNTVDGIAAFDCD